MDRLRWLRMIGDTVFALGTLSLGWFVLGLKTGWSLGGESDIVGRAWPEEPPGTQFGKYTNYERF